MPRAPSRPTPEEEEVQMLSRARITVWLLLALSASCTGAIAGASAGASTVATASAKTCDISGEQRELGASYVTSLRVSGTTCTKGKKVVKAFHECRKESGGKNGKCHREVLGYSCEEHRFDAVPDVQYNSRARCERGDKVVRHTYTQNV
jgi:hypothetical protein